MNCEILVVGAGIGGLTAAALLAQRGLDVCVLERQSQVGGCAASFEKFGLEFEQGFGLYSFWAADELHHRIFNELPVEPPHIYRLDPSYVVRLPDQSEVANGASQESRRNQLRAAFPECADRALRFYDNLNSGVHDSYASQAARDNLAAASYRFRNFIDAQLLVLTQRDSSTLEWQQVVHALQTAENMAGISGGTATLAASLADSIRKSGGRIRLNSPVLRLSYGPDGKALGVDLLTGETIFASKAIISNLTVWDTYGKLIGLNSTPPPIRKRLGDLHGWGAYLLFLSLDHDEAARLRAEHFLLVTDWQTVGPYNPETRQLFFNLPRLPAVEGKRAVTVHAFTDVDEWFTFHTGEEELELRDQLMLEECWTKLHRLMPELGSGIEVIETLTPRDIYESNRRKLGMVGNLATGSFLQAPAYGTPLPNVFIISDTVCEGGVAGVSRLALQLTDHLTHIK